MIKKVDRKLNFRMLAKVMGWLLMIEAGFMAIPAAVSLCYGESDWRVLGICSVSTFIVGYSLNRWLRPRRTSMAKREGFLLTAMVWVVFSLFGMVPLIFSSTPLSVTDSFVEAMAGFTTTGISLFSDFACISHGINLWRAMMQWIGGMGIILFTLAVLPMLNSSGGMQMFNAEVTGITHDKIRPRISQTAKSLWLVYILITIACALLLWAGPMDGFDSVCHAFGTVSTGGFSTRQSGVCDWDSPYIYTIVTIFMFLGGTSFSLIYFAATGKFFKLRQNHTMRAYVTIIGITTAIFIVCALIYGQARTFTEVGIYPLFQAVSTLTSTGYTVSVLANWGILACAMLLPIMFIGGCAGSTSGGVKIDRVVVLLSFMRNSIKRALQPNNVTAVKVNGNILPSDIVSKVIAFLCLYCTIVMLGSLALCAMNVPILDSFISSLSCMTNLGVCADVTHLGEGINAIPAAGRLMLAALMLIGRLEVFTILIIFIPNFWHK